MLALIHSAFPEPTHLQMRKLNPDERYRRSRRRTTSRPLSNWTDSTDRERERETESPLFLFTRSARQLVSFHGRFIKGGATKSSAVARGGRREPNISYKHRDLASRMPASGWNRRRVSVISNIARRQERGARSGESCNLDCQVAYLVHVKLFQ